MAKAAVKTKNVYIDGLGEVSISPADQIGSGGFALIFKINAQNKSLALKLWKKVDPLMGRKTEFIIGNAAKWKSLPSNIYVPQHLSRDGKGGPVNGMTMALLPAEHQPMSILFNQQMSLNAGMTTYKKAQLFAGAFADLNAIHLAGLIIVDVSPWNLLFSDVNRYWIDFDSWRIIGNYFGESLMCTEEFSDPLLVPPLPGIQPKYSEPSPDNDRYVLAKILFKAMTGVDPYGGTFGKAPDMPTRIAKRIWVLDRRVTKPSFFPHPEIFSDELLTLFESMFAKNERPVNLAQVVEQYRDSLVECSNCGAWYPRNRKQCPACSAKISMAIPVTEKAMIKELLKLTGGGNIQFVRFYQGTLIVISYERGVVYVNTRGKTGAVTKKSLFPVKPNLHIELIDDKTLAVNQKANRHIEVWDFSQTPRLVTTTTSDVFASNGRVVFRGSDGKLLRIAHRTLLSGKLAFGSELLEDKLPINTSENQTWFWSDQNSDTHLILERVFDQEFFSLVRNGRRLELTLPALKARESVTDISVHFGEQSFLIRRLTRQGNRLYLRTQVVMYDSSLVHSNRVETKLHRNPVVRGIAYTDRGGYVVYHPTDEGLLKEELPQHLSQKDELTSSFLIVAATDKVVTASQRLIHLKSGKHFLLVGNASVQYLILE